MPDTKNIFVIMPFSAANDRDAGDLTEFFNTNLKARIEEEDSFHHKYRVLRSGNEFNILQNIVVQLRESDVVLADLSGSETPNPNVMYELGIRFSVSRLPVILFREDHPSNRDVFDVGQLHCFRYRLNHLRELEEYVIDRLKSYEVTPGSYQSPVLQVVGGEFNARDESLRNEVTLNLQSASASLHVLQRKLAGNVHEFIHERDPSIAGEIEDNIDQFKEWFEKAVDREPVRSLAWNEFRFGMHNMPALANLFVDTRFQNYLPDGIRREVNTRLLDFYIEHFAVAAPYTTAIRVHNTMVDLTNAMAILIAVELFIREDNQDKKIAAYDRLVEMLRHE